MSLALEGMCCPEHLVQGKVEEETICMICYQVMTQPVKLKCGFDHTFGLSCIQEWLQKGKKKCPFCRNEAALYETNQKLKEKVSNFRATCGYCKNWEGKLEKVGFHQQNCEQYYKFIVDELEKTVAQQKNVLDVDINPHLAKEHEEINNKYVQNWFWLYEDVRNWKWWWWANNPWWQKPCKECNNLWHKHEKKIDMLEERRIYLIKKINEEFALDKIKHLFDQSF